MSIVEFLELLVIPLFFLILSGVKYLKTNKKVYLVSFVLLLFGILGGILLF